jgi:CzcA family heavy metal efflux pump
MIQRIIASSLKFRLLVLPAAALLMVFGVAQLRKMPVDVLPEFAPPSVQIQTEALGLSAIEVEQFITVPMEQDLLNGVPWLETIRSQSIAGLSSIELIFKAGTDVLRARQVVGERLTQAVALPHVSKAPVMIDPVSSNSRVMVVGLTSKDMSLIDMSVLARWRIKPHLMGLPGVANVAVWGQRERQLQVQVDPQRLASSGVTLTQVLQTTGNALWVSPLTFVEASTPGTGGFIETPSQRLSIQHILPITTAADLAKVPLEEVPAGKRLRLGDVSQVVEDHQPLIGDAAVDNGPGLMLVIEKAPGANTLEVTQEVEDALRALQPGLSGIKIETSVYRSANYIQSAISTVGIAALIGLILIVALIALAFRDWRTAVSSLVTVPLAVIAALLVLYARGASINMLVVAGVVIATSVLVDEAVVSVDAVRRRLQARGADHSRSVTSMVIEGLQDVRGPMTWATLIILVTAGPLFLIDGIAGSFLRPLALSYLLAVVAATVVALCITPVVAGLLFARTPTSDRESPVLRGLRRLHAAGLRRAAGAPRLTVWFAAIAICAGLAVLPYLGSPLLPALQDRSLLIRWTGTPSISMTETLRITGQASADLRALAGVQNVGVHVGRAITSDQTVGVNSAELWVSMRPEADYRSTLAKIQKVVDGYPGFQHRLMSYPQQRVSDLLTGTDRDITVRVFGKDIDTLRGKAEEVRRLLATVPGVVAPKLDLPPNEPTIEIEVNLAAAARLGIKPGDVRRATATLLSGLTAGSLFEDQKVFDVVVLGVPSVRDNLSDVQNLLIDTPSGGHVRLKDVADVRIRPDPTVVAHDNVSRRVDITAAVNGRDPAAVATDIKHRLTAVTFPVEYHAEVIGPTTPQWMDRAQAGVLVLAVTVAVFLLLQAAFGSWRIAWLLIVTLPLAPVGGLFTALLVHPGLSVGALLGLAGVWALAVRNGVLLVRRWQALEVDEGEPFGWKLVLRGTGERLAPVLMSATATAVAMLPMVFLGDRAGLELLRPLAIVVLGGLVTSTALSLFLLPVVYLHFGSSRSRDADERADELAPALPVATSSRT